MGIDDSFKPGVTETGPKGQLAHPTTLEHSKRLEKKLYKAVSYTHLTLPTSVPV